MAESSKARKQSTIEDSQKNERRNMEEKKCLNCGKTDERIPLLNLTFKGEAKYVCAQCFPILIHKIHLLAEKLPGVEIPPPAAQ
jgi:DNA-directed RNA polymerase subunit RPC12/RpoP